MMDVLKPEHFVDYLLVLFRIVTADLVEFAAQIFHKANFEGRNVSDEQITKGKVLSDEPENIGNLLNPASLIFGIQTLENDNLVHCLFDDLTDAF